MVFVLCTGKKLQRARICSVGVIEHNYAYVPLNITYGFCRNYMVKAIAFLRDIVQMRVSALPVQQVALPEPAGRVCCPIPGSVEFARPSFWKIHGDCPQRHPALPLYKKSFRLM